MPFRNHPEKQNKTERGRMSSVSHLILWTNRGAPIENRSVGGTGLASCHGPHCLLPTSSHCVLPVLELFSSSSSSEDLSTVSSLCAWSHTSPGKAAQNLSPHPCLSHSSVLLYSAVGLKDMFCQGCSAEPAPYRQLKAKHSCMREGVRAAWAGKACTVPAALLWHDFMLLLRYTAGSILLFCLGSACSFPIPWEGPILLWTGGPDPNSHLLLLQLFIPGALGSECHTVPCITEHHIWHESQPWFVSPDCCNSKAPQKPCTPDSALHMHQPQHQPAPLGTRSWQQNSHSAQMHQSMFAYQDIFLFPPKDGTRIHQKRATQHPKHFNVCEKCYWGPPLQCSCLSFLTKRQYLQSVQPPPEWNPTWPSYYGLK